MRYVIAVLLTFTAVTCVAQGIPPFPCEGLTPTASQVHITYHGLSSGCSDQGGSCITGETVIFTAVSTFPCPLGYFWQFPDGTVDGPTSTNRLFSVTGPVTVKLKAVSLVNTSVTVETTLNVVLPSALPLFGPWFAIALLLLLAGIAVLRVG